MNMRIAGSHIALALLLPGLAQAAIDVVATSTSTAALVREIAGEHARVTVLAPPDRDLHYLQVRPSMMRDLRGADLVTAIGSDLEVGWLPVAIQQAANPRIRPGQPGYFEAAAQVPLLDAGRVADRAQGDVHPTGNPHLNMDPLRMAQVGVALGERLAQLDPTNAAGYRARAAAFSQKTEQRLPLWRERTAGHPGAVVYHTDVSYLLDRFDVPMLGTLEPVPGVPPSAGHIRSLTERLKGRKGILLYTSYQPEAAPKALAQALGWPTARLPLEPPLDADGEAYLEHIGRWVDALAEVR
jgi:zinc/manganese transport system substrate-binding protein